MKSSALAIAGKFAAISEIVCVCRRAAPGVEEAGSYQVRKIEERRFILYFGFFGGHKVSTAEPKDATRGIRRSVGS